jgi:hypothetical protein
MTPIAHHLLHAVRYTQLGRTLAVALLMVLGVCAVRLLRPFGGRLAAPAAVVLLSVMGAAMTAEAAGEPVTCPLVQQAIFTGLQALLYPILVKNLSAFLAGEKAES